MIRRVRGFDSIVDAVFGVLVAVLTLVIAVIERDGFGAVAGIALGGALVIRRTSPGLAIGLAWAAAVAQMAGLGSIAPYDLVIPIIVYATAAFGGQTVRWIGLGSVVIGSLVATGYLVLILPMVGDDGLQPAALGSISSVAGPGVILELLILATLGLAWTAGLLLRTMRISRENRVDARVADARRRYELASEQERTRIARDMHDVVAHSLAVVIAQADGARYLGAENPAAQTAALGTIATTARSALGDVRSLLAELRQDSSTAPQPRAQDIPELIERMRAGGMEITFADSETSEHLGSGSQIAAFRIVQEALTNALRHGTGGADVAIEDADSGITIRVGNPIASGTITHGAGHGLPGMRERAQLAGGTLTAGLSSDSTHFTVSAFLPTTGGQS